MFARGRKSVPAAGRRAVVVQLGKSKVLIGAPIVEWASRDSFAEAWVKVIPLYMSTADSTSAFIGAIADPFGPAPKVMASPFGRREMDFPFSFQLDDRRVRMIWGTRRDTVGMLLGQADTLYEATLTATGWSLPRVIAKGAVYEWEPKARSAVIQNGGTTILATSAYDNDADPKWMGLVVGRGRDRMTITRLDEDSKPAYMTIAGDGGRRLMLVYAVTMDMGKEHVYGLVWRESRDNGATWSPHAFIRPFPTGHHWPQVVWQKDGPHLLWLQRPDAATKPAMVRHLWFDSHTWREAPPLFLPASDGTITVTATRQAIVFASQLLDGRVLTAEWRGDHWLPIVDVPFPATLGGPDLYVLHPDTLMMVGMTARVFPTGPPTGGPLTVASVRPANCR
jgi:hypothetical protein